MTIKMFQADAFTDKLFGGNPAAICILPEWLPETLMQNIAAENNLAETAFIVPAANGYEIRWFTPVLEVDLCGHATLAAAHIIFEHYNSTATSVSFYSLRSGILHVSKQNNLLTLDFPVDSIQKITTPPALVEGLGIEPMETWRGKTDFLAVLPSEEDVRKLHPNFDILNLLDARGIIVTALGNSSDFVSRFFSPKSGLNEDPVTGSAHTTLTAYWAKELKKDKLSAIQLSKRAGHLLCELRGDRVDISGQVVTYLQGEIKIAR